MEIPDLIKEIVKTAESNIDIDPNHTDDAISVGIYFDSSANEFQVWIERPTQKQLAERELSFEEAFGNKPITTEVSSRFMTINRDLYGALFILLDKVQNYNWKL